jgi:hypothetical protein
MPDRDDEYPASEHSRKPNDDRDSIIPGKHGKHGGSEESEGAPQEPTPEAQRPSEHNGSDRMRH